MKKEAMKFTDSAVELFKEVYDISGGAVVVEELPEVGEPNTLYELCEDKPASYDWVAMITDQMRIDEVALKDNNILIFDTYEQMTSIINNLNTENLGVQEFYGYLRNEDKLYTGHLQEGPDGPTWRYEEITKVQPCVFNLEKYYYLCVLKSYEGLDETPSHLGYWGTLLDGTEICLGAVTEDDVYNAFILHQATFDDMGFFIANDTVHPVSTLPTAEELVANYLDELIAGIGSLEFEIDGVVKYNESENSNYRWVQELENFYQPWEEGTEPSEIYTGELDWNSYGDPTFETIPYQELFNMSEEAFWYFKPWKGGEKISYWIYTNNEWVDINNLPNPTDYIAIPVLSRGIVSAVAIPFDKIRIYEDDVLLDKYLVDLVPIEEAYGCYVYVPRNMDFYNFKIEFDEDVPLDKVAQPNVCIYANMNISNDPDAYEYIDVDNLECYISGPAGKMVITNAGTK